MGVLLICPVHAYTQSLAMNLACLTMPAGMHIVDVEVSPSDGWKVAWLAPLTVVVVVSYQLVAGNTC